MEPRDHQSGAAAAPTDDASARFELVVQATNDVVYDWVLPTGRIWWSPTLEAVFGYTAEDLHDIEAWERCLHPDDRERTARSLSDAVARGDTTWTSEYRFRHRNGTYLDVLDRAHVLSGKDRQPERLIGAMMDQTARKRSERVQAALFRISKAASETASLEELLREIHAVIGTLTYAPNLYVALHDPREQVLRFPYWSDQHDPPVRVSPLGRGLTEYVLRTDAPLLIRNRAALEELRAKGEVEPVGARAQSWVGVPLRAPDRVLGVLVAQIYEGETRYGEADLELLQFVSTQVAHAIEHKQAEDALRESERRFRAVIEHSLDGIVLLDPHLHIAYQSPSSLRILGLRGPSEPGATFAGIHPDDLPHVRAVMDEASRHPTVPMPVTARVRGPGGSWRQLEAVVTNLLEDPAVRSVVVNFRDVTERTEMEARLMMADRMVSVGTLAAGVAHEINNPLAYVIANLSYLADGLSQRESVPQKEMLEVVAEAQDGAERVRKIVRDLKTFSRDAEEIVGPVDLAEVIDASANLAWNEMRHRARLVKDLDPSMPQVLGNESRLAQVFLNLMVNAAQAIPVGAADRNEIHIASRVRDGWVEVRVSDTGAGIPLALQRRIFDPFFTTKPTGEGTGLGLFICQNILRSYGGRISVTSREGAGATFTVELPAAGQATSAEARPAGQAATTPRGRILVIDDEAFVVGALRRLLSKHEVVGETEAGAALARLRGGERFDVILCDLMMPRLSGMDFHAAVAKESPEEAARIIFMTGGAFTPAARDFLATTPNVHVQKPFDARALRALIAGRLGG